MTNNSDESNEIAAALMKSGMIKPGEFWGNLLGFSRYLVGAHGEVISLTSTPKKLKPIKMGKYDGFQLSDDNRTCRKMYRHRAVAELIYGPCPEGLECCHNDSDKSNCDYTNLRWDTRVSNEADKPTSQRITNVKYTEEDIRQIRTRFASGERQSSRGHPIVTPMETCEMNTSEEVNEIASALAKAQGSITNPQKTSENPHFRSRYADLASGINAVRQALAANGIAFIQAPRLWGEWLMLDTRLMHSSGQWIQSEYLICKAAAPPQQVGSALSYGRRYSLFALVGISGDDDDDGNAANAASANGKDDNVITASQVEELRENLDRTNSDEERFLKFLKIGSLTVLPAKEFNTAMAALEAKAKVAQ